LERKVLPSDYTLIRNACEKVLKKVKRRKAKLWFQYVDIEATVDFILKNANSYILDESYLVVYAIGTPWYAKPDVKMLEEMFVLKLENAHTFPSIPAFLERKGAEAGVSLVGVGTALTRYDDALASMYEASGFQREAIMLVKETNVR
jgi:hypothetical protein